METRKNIILVAAICDYKNRVMRKYWGTYLSSVFQSVLVTIDWNLSHMTIQFYIFLLLNVSRRIFTYWFLAEKTQEMTPWHRKTVYWICELNLNLRLWDQHKPENNLHISLTHDLIWNDSKMWVCDLQVCRWQVCELQAQQFTSYNSTNL